MKKKDLMMLAAALVLAAGAGSSYAYLTAHDGVTNVFGVAEVGPRIIEDFEPEPPEPGKAIKKAPKIESNSDTDCYVRMRYEFSSSDAEALCEPIEANQGWTRKEDGWYYWGSAVRPGEGTGTLFDRIQVKPGVTQEEVDAARPFDILVYAEATDASGGDAETAWASMD